MRYHTETAGSQDLAKRASPGREAHARPSPRVGREAPKYLLRLPEEMRATLQREASLNGRSVNTEILGRLQHTLDQQHQVRSRGYRAADPAEDEFALRNDLERAMLGVFRKLQPEKQLALLSLFK